MGGLGVRKLSDIALPSYLASIHSTKQLVLRILPQRHAVGYEAFVQDSVGDWEATFPGVHIPESMEAQRAWDTALSASRREALLQRSDQFSRARILAAAAPRSGAWLSAVPSRSIGLALDPETIRISVAFRVGSNICLPHKCRCGATVDSKGLHTLSCKYSAGRFPRHSAINDVIKRALSGCGIPSLLEPVGINRGDGKRPDGVTLFPFSRGKCLVWDATVADTFAKTNVLNSAVLAASAAEEAEDLKRRKYGGLAENYLFEPLARKINILRASKILIFVKSFSSFS